ncbi:MAG: hypothetical protein PSX80_08695 [bacterium]|nr:hypothetical protein [bacterium]
MTEELWLKLAQVANDQMVAATFRRTSDLALILIKGWSISRFYDSGHIRVSNDVDLIFCPRDEATVSEVIANLDLPVAIDAHFGPRHLDILPFENLFERSYTVQLNGVPIRVLADEDNLRITAVHWLTDGGVNREKLWDIYYLVKNRKEGFDWERCLESNGPIRKTWVMAAIATARDHLDLDVSGLPEEVREFKLPRWYEQTLEKEWRLGIYPRRILSTVVFRPKLLIEQLRRKLPPNRIAATIDTETLIDDSSRIPAQVESLTKKVGPFARGLGRRITYLLRGQSK